MSVVVVAVVVVVVVDEGRSPVKLVVLRNTSTMVKGNREVKHQGATQPRGNLNSRKGLRVVTPGV